MPARRGLVLAGRLRRASPWGVDLQGGQVSDAMQPVRCSDGRVYVGERNAVNCTVPELTSAWWGDPRRVCG